MDLEVKVGVEGEEGEEVQAPPKAQELLSAVQEFDKKSDPLDLSFGGRHLDDVGAAEALKAGRKLSRLARRLAQAEIEDAKTENGGWTKKQLAAWGVPWPPPKGWKEALAARLAAGSLAEEEAPDADA